MKHLSTKTCAKSKYYEQLTKLLLIKFETNVLNMKNNINFEDIWMQNFHQELKK
jgi:hypothetical protein